MHTLNKIIKEDKRVELLTLIEAITGDEGYIEDLKEPLMAGIDALVSINKGKAGELDEHTLKVAAKAFKWLDQLLKTTESDLRDEIEAVKMTKVANNTERDIKADIAAT